MISTLQVFKVDILGLKGLMGLSRSKEEIGMAFTLAIGVLPIFSKGRNN
jgi:hypothetical protein